ncbi:hypothetical protein MOF51_10420, partial [Bacillus paralicheniformis]|nr:hypothetical protein [Bacillus paralicheniformis]
GVGVVTDICFSNEGTCLGLIMEEKRRFYNPRSLLPLPAVTEIGRDSVYVVISPNSSRCKSRSRVFLMTR